MKRVLLLFLILAPAFILKAQVTIGSGIEPADGALLDLKTFGAGSLNETSVKGILYPRVRLEDNYKEELHPMYNVTGTEYLSNIAHLKKIHTGLVVFNVTEGSHFSPGLYMWNGKEWRKIEDSTPIKPSIGDLLCTNAFMSPNNYSAGQSFSGIVRIPYTEGNGGKYAGTLPSPLVNGLRIERIEGQLAVGGGEVMYKVSGTPEVSSPATTIFPIDFLGKTCNIEVGSGASSLNLKNLESDVTITTPFAGDSESTADQLTFGDITIREAGSYAFSLRLYGRLSQNKEGRWPFYIYLQKNNKSTVLDAAEIDLVTVVVVGNPDFSYSITLGGVYEAGDKVIISMHRPTGSLTGQFSVPTWKLYTGANKNPVRTSLIYWKL